jgi:hypothetical protein
MLSEPYIIILFTIRILYTARHKLATVFALTGKIERGNFMFRLWAKVFKDNRMIRDMVVCNDNSELRRTQKIFMALDDICHAYDLSKPIWLDSTINDFKRHDKARFTKDNFMEPIDFDFLEIHIIEED